MLLDIMKFRCYNLTGDQLLDSGIWTLWREIVVLNFVKKDFKLLNAVRNSLQP